MSATASGLLGCTLGEVTDGQPFCGVDGVSRFEIGRMMVVAKCGAYLIKIHFLAVSVFNKPVQVILNQWPRLVR